MNLAHHGPVKFVDDGYPEAADYANNYIRLTPPPTSAKQKGWVRPIFAGIRSLLGRLRPRAR